LRGTPTWSDTQDDATSLIDFRTARSLEGSTHSALAGRTVVAIAHRLHTSHDADRIAVLTTAASPNWTPTTS
jgi:ABC-type multidrug transport system fused ATPase/permease subunit